VQRVLADNIYNSIQDIICTRLRFTGNTLKSTLSFSTASPRTILHWSCRLFCIKSMNHSAPISLISEVHNCFRSSLFSVQNVSKCSILSTHIVWHFAHGLWNFRDTNCNGSVKSPTYVSYCRFALTDIPQT